MSRPRVRSGPAREEGRRQLNQLHSTAAKLPAHEQVYRALRDIILAGDLAPGQPVTILGLTRTLAAGMTPVREAIRRLISEGALVFLGNRRVVVPALSPGQLDEIAFMRGKIEPQLAYWAAERLDQDGISRIAAIDARIDAALARGDVTGYLVENRRFHMTLYAAAGRPLMLDTVAPFWLRTAPTLRMAAGRLGTQNLPDMHVEALAALRAGDAGGVERAIAADIEQGHDSIRRVLDAAPPLCAET